MLLELGSGERPFHDGRDWIHSDFRTDLPDIEMEVWADRILDYVPEESIDELRACHILEHISHRDTLRVLSEWRLALKHDAIVHIEVPNLEWQCKALLGVPCDPPGSSFTKDKLVEYIYGGDVDVEDFPENYHKMGFTPEILSDKLGKAGFIDIRVQDIGQVLVADARRS